MTHCNLPIEAVLGANHVTKGSEGYAAPGRDVEYLVNLRVAAEVSQHAQTIGLCQWRRHRRRNESSVWADLERVIVADRKICVWLIEQAVLV